MKFEMAKRKRRLLEKMLGDKKKIILIAVLLTVAFTGIIIGRWSIGLVNASWYEGKVLEVLYSERPMEDVKIKTDL